MKNPFTQQIIFNKLFVNSLNISPLITDQIFDKNSAYNCDSLSVLIHLLYIHEVTLSYVRYMTEKIWRFYWYYNSRVVFKSKTMVKISYN